MLAKSRATSALDDGSGAAAVRGQNGRAAARPLLELAGVSKRFGAQLALDRVSLDLRPGEVHALLGHNGSGKSTLVKILSGFHRPDEGALIVDGSPVELGDGDAARAAGLRFVHQDLALVASLSVTDNVMLADGYPRRGVCGIDWRQARQEVAELLGEHGYEIDGRAIVAQLKPVERTGVAIARALRGSTRARVLVLDEPTAALPADAVETLFGALRRLRASGLGIIYISHHIEEVFSIADRVTVLRDGRAVASRKATELTEDELVELIIGETVDAREPRTDHVPQTARPVFEVRRLSAGSLRGLDLNLNEGEIVGIAGVAGSGRDELAPALFGSISRNGSVSIDGSLIPPARPDRAIASGLGMVGADRARTGLVAQFTVAENLTLPRIEGRLRGWFLSQRREEQDSLEWLDLVQLRPRIPSKPTSELSGGNQQKILLGRWLRALPRVLIVDQPTEGVDVATVGQIYKIIRKCAAQGTAFIVCSSDAEELVALCHRVVVLNQGVQTAMLTGSDINRELIDHLCLAARGRRSGSP